MGLYPVGEAKERALWLRMERLGIREKDLRESFVRSGGPGGQNVNKTSTCVQLEHAPTGLRIKCSASRSLALNRFTARRILTERIERLLLGRRTEEQRRIEKIRRQKRRRSRRAREKMLEDKRHQAEKKSLRQIPGAED
jgi:protein subunit release factor B